MEEGSEVSVFDVSDERMKVSPVQCVDLNLVLRRKEERNKITMVGDVREGMKRIQDDVEKQDSDPGTPHDLDFDPIFWGNLIQVFPKFWIRFFYSNTFKIFLSFLYLF